MLDRPVTAIGAPPNHLTHGSPLLVDNSLVVHVNFQNLIYFRVNKLQLVFIIFRVKHPTQNKQALRVISKSASGQVYVIY